MHPTTTLYGLSIQGYGYLMSDNLYYVYFCVRTNDSASNAPALSLK